MRWGYVTRRPVVLVPAELDLAPELRGNELSGCRVIHVRQCQHGCQVFSAGARGRACAQFAPSSQSPLRTTAAQSSSFAKGTHSHPILVIGARGLDRFVEVVSNRLGPVSIESVLFSWNRDGECSDVVLAGVVLSFPLCMYPVDRLVSQTCGKVVSAWARR